MYELSRPTKHVTNSQLSLYEVSLYEVRKIICDDTGYQTHPTSLPPSCPDHLDMIREPGQKKSDTRPVLLAYEVAYQTFMVFLPTTVFEPSRPQAVLLV
jgi:hypothetical protein